MKIYVAFDDTDTLDCGRGTGKLARWFEEKLPSGCRMTGVVRHQLLIADNIPYTSHNSSLCTIIETDNFHNKLIDDLATLGAQHIKDNFFEGSDPGLCIAAESNPSLKKLVEFAHVCITRKVTQQEAITAAGNVHLSGHGGTNDGIIGAAAAVGLTHEGLSGRFIEIVGEKRLRDYPEITTVKELKKSGIEILNVDRHSARPHEDDMIDNKGWLRPRLFNGKPVLPVIKNENGFWEVVGYNKKNN